MTRIALGLLVALVLAAPASAQNFRLIDPPTGLVQKAPHDPPPFTHWDLREMPACEVPWIMGTAPVIDLDGNFIADEASDRAIALAIFQAAFDEWDAVAPSKLNFVEVAGTPPVGGAFLDGYNTVIFDANTLAVPTIAAAFVTRNATSGVILECDIVFNTSTATTPYGVLKLVTKAHGVPCDADLDLFPYGNWPTPADGDTDVNGNFIQEWEADIHTVMLHEIGHFIGLEHMDPLGGTMNDPANAVMEQYWFMPAGPTGGGRANHIIKEPDIDGENFLYTPDLGDAPDPLTFIVGQYPTLVHLPNTGRVLNGIVLDGIGTGAEHIFGIKDRQPARNWTYEWLGRPGTTNNVDAECEANVTDLDPFDDGVTWYPNPPVWGRNLTVTAWAHHARDNVGNFHDYSLNPLFTNAWIDLNQDGVWNQFAPEWFMASALSPPPPIGANSVSYTTATASVFLPYSVPNPSLPVWLRARLDWGENVGYTYNIDGTLAGPAGAAQFGEVEDYPLWCYTAYHSQWVRNTTNTDLERFVTVYTGPPNGESTAGGETDANGCETVTDPPASHPYVYDGTYDESMWTSPTGPFVLSNSWRRLAVCRPASYTITPLRSFYLSNWNGFVLPRQYDVLPAYWIPTVHLGLCPVGGSVGSPTGIVISVGTTDFTSGGWIAPGGTRATSAEDASPGGWSDTLQVSIWYRVSPTVVPIENLEPCDPLVAPLAKVFVGTGSVTPEDGVDFPLLVPAQIAPGQSLIVEVESSWSTNSTVNHQLIEFIEPLGPATSVGDAPRPSRLALENYPNPFNPNTTIRFALPVAAKVSLAVYDVSGRLVRTLLRDANRAAGVFEAEWNGRDDRGEPVASGVYFYRLEAGAETLTRKAVLLK